MRLGYVGLGRMGGAIARRLLKSRPLRVYDLRPAAIADLGAAGGIATQSPAALARECDLVFTCLPTSAEVRTALFGEDGIAAGLPEGGIVVDMTTGDPLATRALAEELAKSGRQLVDAPVSGGPAGAAAGTLAIMVGGTPEAFARCKPALEAISPNVFHTGAVGTGHTMKLVNNVVAAATRQVTFEALALGVKNGLDFATCVEVLSKGSGCNYTLTNTMPLFMADPSRLSFTMALMLKDVKLATQLGRDTGVPMPLCGLAHERLLAGLHAHGAEVDNMRLLKSYEDEAGVDIVNDPRW